MKHDDDAMNKDVDSIIVERGVGDIHLLANTNIGKLFIQFRGFAAAMLMQKREAKMATHDLQAVSLVVGSPQIGTPKSQGNCPK